MGWLKDRLKTSRIQLKWQNPEVSCIEAVLARGDRRLTQVLLTAQGKGCLFDSWTDQFKFRLWQESFQECGVDPDFYTTRVRTEEEPLPWDHIDIQVAKEYLAEEWREAVSGNLPPDCREGECQGCGVCDFERVSPQLYTSCHESSRVSILGPIRTDGGKQIVVDYSKRGEAKYFGHLELSNIFSRAIRRTGIAVRYSEGFHPKPRISFDDPLPIGMESQSEVMYVQLENGISMEAFKDRLNEQLPEGLVVNDCRALEGRPKQPASKAVTYEITLSQSFFDDLRLNTW